MLLIIACSTASFQLHPLLRMYSSMLFIYATLVCSTPFVVRISSFIIASFQRVHWYAATSNRHATLLAFWHILSHAICNNTKHGSTIKTSTETIFAISLISIIFSISFMYLIRSAGSVEPHTRFSAYPPCTAPTKKSAMLYVFTHYIALNMLSKATLYAAAFSSFFSAAFFAASAAFSSFSVEFAASANALSKFFT